MIDTSVVGALWRFWYCSRWNGWERYFGVGHFGDTIFLGDTTLWWEYDILGIDSSGDRMLWRDYRYGGMMLGWCTRHVGSWQTAVGVDETFLGVRWARLQRCVLVFLSTVGATARFARVWFSASFFEQRVLWSRLRRCASCVSSVYFLGMLAFFTTDFSGYATTLSTDDRTKLPSLIFFCFDGSPER